MLEKILNKEERKFLCKMLLFIIILNLAISKFVIKFCIFCIACLYFFISYIFLNDNNIIDMVFTGNKYSTFYTLKTSLFSKCNDFGCYYISFCDKKHDDYCSTKYYNKFLNDKLLFSDKINNIYINNNTLYVVIPKNIKYNVINKNILKKISYNYYELDNKKYGVNYMIVKNE